MEAISAAAVLTSVTAASLAVAVLLSRATLAVLFYLLPRPSAQKQ